MLIDSFKPNNNFIIDFHKRDKTLEFVFFSRKNHSCDWVYSNNVSGDDKFILECVLWMQRSLIAYLAGE